ncbi:hypothetical protein EON66_05445 [archaeon]|nr:MAG: hypothetical protein EON66_05445 [archaeon]
MGALLLAHMLHARLPSRFVSAQLEAALKTAESAQAQAREEAFHIIASTNASKEAAHARVVATYERELAALKSRMKVQTAEYTSQMQVLQSEVLQRMQYVAPLRRVRTHVRSALSTLVCVGCGHFTHDGIVRTVPCVGGCRQAERDRRAFERKLQETTQAMLQRAKDELAATHIALAAERETVRAWEAEVGEHTLPCMFVPRAPQQSLHPTWFANSYLTRALLAVLNAVRCALPCI